jgi:DNA-binding CsgD family transcriptional regulator
MNENDGSRLSRHEWYAALLDAHGADPNETASSLCVRTSVVEQLLERARAKLGARSSSEIRRVIPS